MLYFPTLLDIFHPPGLFISLLLSQTEKTRGRGFIIPQPTDSSLLARICCGSCLSCSVSCSVFFPERRLLLPYVERYSSNIFGIKTFLPFSHRSSAFVQIASRKQNVFRRLDTKLLSDYWQLASKARGSQHLPTSDIEILFLSRVSTTFGDSVTKGGFYETR